MGIVYDDEAPPTIQYDEPPPAKTWGDSLHNFREGMDASVRGIVRGIPIIGPALDTAVNVGVAAPSAVIPGQSVKGSFDALNTQGERIAQEHPAADLAGNIAGGLVSTVPAARAFPAVFGGSSFAGQTLVGGLMGGTDAAIRSGGDPSAIKTGAALGAAGPTMGHILAPIGQGLVSAGRAAVDYVPGLNKIFQPRIMPAPNAAIGQAAENGYQSLHQYPYDPAALGDLTDLIKRDLHAQSKSGQIGATETHRILDTLDSLPPTAGSLHTVRKELGKVEGGDEGFSARYAKDKIDQFLENPPPSAYAGGQAHAVQAGPILQEANANYRAFSNSDELRNRVTKAKLDAAGSHNPIPFLPEGQAVRKQVRNWLTSDKQSRFLMDNERQALTDVGRGSLGERALQMVGAVSGTSRPGAFTAITPLLTGVYSGLAPAAVGVAAGVGANTATSALTRRAVNQADAVIRANAPYSQSYMASQLPPRLSMSPPVSQMPPSISAGAHRDEVARLLALQAERSATEPKRLTIDTTDWQ
jgi:hypothetical protein